MQRVPVPIAAQLLGVVVSPIYTAPSSTISTVANLSFTNTSGSPATVTLYNVPSGGSPATGNELISAFSIAAGRTYVPAQAIGLNLAPGSSLQAIAGVTNAIVAQGGAYETSGS